MAELFERRLSRRSVLRAGAAVGPLLLLRPSTASADEPLGPRRLSWGADPTTTVGLGLSLPSGVQRARLLVGLVDRRLERPIDVEMHGVAGVGTRYGQVTVPELRPGTFYRYAVELDGRRRGDGRFATLAQQPVAFTFTAFGDEGTSDTARAILRQIQTISPAFHLVSGDLCYADASGAGHPDDQVHPVVWDEWLRMINRISSEIPWMNAVGNHEMEPGQGPQGYDGYLARFVRPDNGARACPATHHFRAGAAAFVQVDSNDVSNEIPANRGYSGGKQTRWLDDVLARYRQDPTISFLVVTMHHCGFSSADSHGSDSGVRDNWTPLFDRHGVDLVLSGHNHAFERSHLLRGGVPVVAAPPGATVDSRQGTSYLVVGGGGATAAHSFAPDRPTLVRPDGRAERETAQFSAVRSLRHSFLTARVTPPGPGAHASLRLVVRADDGAVLDQVTLTRPAAPPAPSDRPDAAVIGGAATLGGLAGGAGVVAVQRRRSGRDEPGTDEPKVRPTAG
jgi:hypothetical protein